MGDPQLPAPDPVEVEDDCWISYNLYTRSHDTTLRRVIAPTVVELLRDRLATSFFFVRYFDDRGTHVRIRLSIQEATLEQVNDHFVSGVQASYRQCEDLVPPTRSVEAAPLVLSPSSIELEIERYGGPESFLESLRFFCISSVHSLHFVEKHHASRAVKRLAVAMSLLLCQALGFARTRLELLALLDYFSGWRERMAAVVASADQAFDRHPESWCRIFRATSLVPSEPTAGPGSVQALFCASRSLSDATADLAPNSRLELARSHMHMTANRIGLSNAWESYVSQLLCRSATAIEASDPGFWAEVEQSIANPSGNGGRAQGTPPLDEQLEGHLNHFVETWRRR